MHGLQLNVTDICLPVGRRDAASRAHPFEFAWLLAVAIELRRDALFRVLEARARLVGPDRAGGCR
jgi:hypothetical protein